MMINLDGEYGGDAPITLTDFKITSKCMRILTKLVMRIIHWR
jgi:diacylglycerol kinase family enzyme